MRLLALGFYYYFMIFPTLCLLLAERLLGADQIWALSFLTGTIIVSVLPSLIVSWALLHFGVERTWQLKIAALGGWILAFGIGVWSRVSSIALLHSDLYLVLAPINILALIFGRLLLLRLKAIWLRRKVDRNAPETMTALARLYDWDLNNEKRAVKWYRKAAEMGSVEAMEELEWLLDDAPEEAEKWKREAARLREIETSRDLSGLQPES